MNNKEGLVLLFALTLATGFGCHDLDIDSGTDPVETTNETSCGSQQSACADPGFCSTVFPNFCGANSNPPSASCLTTTQNSVESLTVLVGPQSVGPISCQFVVTGDAPSATVCIYPPDDSTCSGDVDKMLLWPGGDLVLPDIPAAGARIVVISNRDPTVCTADFQLNCSTP
jgi:hypothetical protein